MFFRLFMVLAAMSWHCGALQAQSLSSTGSGSGSSGSGAAIIDLLSSTGKLIPDVETNSFIVVDQAPNIAMIEEYLKMIDTPSKQVLIEARIVEVKLEGEHAFGVNWAAFTDGGRLGGDWRVYGTDAAGATQQGLWQAIPFQQPKYEPITGSAQNPFTLGIYKGNMDIVLQALATELKTDIISAPKITTTNNRRAKIDVVKTIPYLEEIEKEDEETESGTTTTYTYSYSYADEGVSLEVTPLINPDGSITMVLIPQVKEIIRFREVLGPAGAGSSPELPETDVRIAQTKVTVNAGETLVIGGLIRDKGNDGELKVPFLGDVPMLGNFFRQKIRTTQKTELLIFVSPVIIDPNAVQRMQNEISKDNISRRYPIDEITYSARSFEDDFAEEIVLPPAPDDIGVEIDRLDRDIDELSSKQRFLKENIEILPDSRKK